MSWDVSLTADLPSVHSDRFNLPFSVIRYPFSFKCQLLGGVIAELHASYEQQIK